MPQAGTWGGILQVALLGALFVGTALPACGAETAPPGDTDGVVSEQQILQALKPARTRGFPARGLGRRPEAAGPDGAVSPAPVPAAPAAVNLNVPFEYNSSTLKPDAARQLQVLEHALDSDLLKSDRFLVAGHTDARGSAEFNKRLSLRRAEAVRQFLVAHGVAASRLSSVGYGAEQLLVPDRPDDPSNRRVEIRDLGAEGASAP